MFVIGLWTVSGTPAQFNTANDSPRAKTQKPFRSLNIRHTDAFTHGWMNTNVWQSSCADKSKMTVCISLKCLTLPTGRDHAIMIREHPSSIIVPGGNRKRRLICIYLRSDSREVGTRERIQTPRCWRPEDLQAHPGNLRSDFKLYKWFVAMTANSRTAPVYVHGSVEFTLLHISIHTGSQPAEALQGKMLIGRSISKNT